MLFTIGNREFEFARQTSEIGKLFCGMYNTETDAYIGVHFFVSKPTHKYWGFQQDELGGTLMKQFGLGPIALFVWVAYGE
jgi:hypothetical protein